MCTCEINGKSKSREGGAIEYATNVRQTPSAEALSSTSADEDVQAHKPQGASSRCSAMALRQNPLATSALHAVRTPCDKSVEAEAELDEASS